MKILNKYYIIIIIAVFELSACSEFETFGVNSARYYQQKYNNFYAAPLCQFTVFEGRTFDSRNKIKVCMKSRLGKNYMEFHFDTLGELAQRPLIVKAKDVTWENSHTRNTAYDRLIVNEHNYGMIVSRTIKHGVASGKLKVKINGRIKTYIIDPISMSMKTTYRGHTLADFGVVSAVKNTDRFSSGRVLAPEQ